MALYAIIALSEPEKLKQAVITQYGANHYEFGRSTWFVADDGSSKQVSDRLGLTNGGIGSTGVVLLFTAYSGWGPPGAWAWLQERGSAIPNG